MKKVAIALIALFFVFGVFSYSAALSDEVTSPGAYLKKIGIVKGFPGGSLRENQYITQAEYLSLLARTLRSVKTVRRDNLVKQTNSFDRFINKAYHAYLILKYKFADFYYRVYMRLKRTNEASSNRWYFEDLVYLKKNGFNIPEGFKPDSVLSEKNAVKWAMEVFGLGESKEYLVKSGDVDDAASSFVLSVEHGVAIDGINPAKPIKRREAFSLIICLIAK